MDTRGMGRLAGTILCQYWLRQLVCHPHAMPYFWMIIKCMHVCLAADVGCVA